LIFDENSNNYRFNNLFLKAYCFLRLKDSISYKPKNINDVKIIERLLFIIENDNFKDLNTTIRYEIDSL
jgi:hypothetical protein